MDTDWGRRLQSRHMAGREPKTLSTFLLVQIGAELLDIKRDAAVAKATRDDTCVCLSCCKAVAASPYWSSRVLQLTREDAFTVKLRLAELPEAADRSISEDVTLNSAVPSVMLLVTSALVAFRTDLY